MVEALYSTVYIQGDSFWGQGDIKHTSSYLPQQKDCST
jgi:hypothetical protein